MHYNIKKIKNPILTLVSLVFLYTVSYFYFSMLTVSNNMKDIIKSLEPEKPFTNFIVNFDNPALISSAITFIIISLFFLLISFLNSKYKFKRSLTITILSLFFTIFSLKIIIDDNNLMKGSVSIIEAITADEFIKSQKPSNTLYFLKNSKEYLDSYKNDRSLENKIKFMTAFDIILLNSEGLKSINKENSTIFLEVVKKHIQIVMNHESIVRSSIILSFILFLINLITLHKSNKLRKVNVMHTIKK